MIAKVSYLFLVGGIVAVVNGFALEDAREKKSHDNHIPQDCSKQPGRNNMKECCPPPKESLWGNLKPSFRLCSKNLQTMLNENGMSGNSGMASTQPADIKNGGRKETYQKTKDILKKIYNVTMKTINNLKENVVIIPDHFRRFGQEECFMECVFEDAGFLMEKKVNKDSLLERLKQTLTEDNQWVQVATSAVEKCHLTLSNIRTNSTCMSGAAPIFHCIHKYIFLNCPTWLQNNYYCTNLKHFYQQCPDGPPPPLDDKPLEEVLNEDSLEPVKM